MKFPNTKIPLTKSALFILSQRYLLKDRQGNILEKPEDMFRRVAKTVAAADILYDKRADLNSLEEKFYSLMANLDFLPNSPTLMNAGRPLGQLSACFVLPLEDSLESIFETLKYTALIHKSGGGTGFSFSHLRPKGDVVRSTQGLASGPLSFLLIYDAATEVIKQGGKRRGANMAVLDVSHPDIEDFITIKRDPTKLLNFNLSVAINERFMQALLKKRKFSLINPRNGKEVRRVSAEKIFSLLVESSWLCGDPGIIFIDHINARNPTPLLGKIEATNPCGEVPLLPMESCNLGSINLARFVKNQSIDYERLRETIHQAVHFLDNVIDVNRFPLPQIEKATRKTRKIGLGVMGFADMLIKLEISYNSDKAIEKAKEIMNFIEKETIIASQELAKKRGNFPAYKGSIWDNHQTPFMRNATTTSIAPTGTISLIAGCSSGIEPLFSVAYRRRIFDGTEIDIIHPLFKRELARYPKEKKEKIIKEALEKGSIAQVKELPPKIRELFVTTFDIPYEQHLLIQAAFQKYVHNAVSKTINFPPQASMEEIKRAFLEAYKLKLKGITIYRYGSKPQPIHIGAKNVKDKIFIPCGTCPKPSIPCPKCTIVDF